MSSKSGFNVVVLGLTLMLLSCRAPVSFNSDTISTSAASAAPSSEAVSSEDQEVVDSVCERADVDSQNAFEGNVFDKPFLNFTFSDGKKGQHKPSQNCVTVKVLEDSDVKREVLYTYQCAQISGTAQQSTEIRDDSIYSMTEQNITVSKNNDERVFRSIEVQEKFKNGSLVIDQEFEESFTTDSGTHEHIITGVNSYDYSSDQVEDEDGNIELMRHSGIVQISGNLEHIKNGHTESVRTVSSNKLHRSACGFDEGNITIRSVEKTISITFTACGKKTVTVE